MKLPLKSVGDVCIFSKSCKLGELGWSGSGAMVTIRRAVFYLEQWYYSSAEHDSDSTVWYAESDIVQ